MNCTFEIDGPGHVSERPVFLTVRSRCQGSSFHRDTAEIDADAHTSIQLPAAKGRRILPLARQLIALWRWLTLSYVKVKAASDSLTRVVMSAMGMRAKQSNNPGQISQFSSAREKQTQPDITPPPRCSTGSKTSTLPQSPGKNPRRRGTGVLKFLSCPRATAQT